MLNNSSNRKIKKQQNCDCPLNYLTDILMSWKPVYFISGLKNKNKNKLKSRDKEHLV